MKGIHGKKRWIILLGAVMALGTGFQAFADDSPISSVRVTFTNVYDNGDENTKVLEPEVSVSDSRYSVDSVTFSKDFDDPGADKKGKAVPGKKVMATIVLAPEDGYRFTGSYGKNGCRVYGADYEGTSIKDGNLVVKANYVPVAKLGQPATAGWGDSTKRRAVWKKVDYANAYQIRLYGDDALVRTITAYANNVDLTPYMNGVANYYYEVKAVPKNNADRAYLREGESVTSDDSLIDNLGDTGGAWRNYQEGRRYQEENGSYVTNSWKLIRGQWYYFNNDGYAVTGWQYINNKWYYLNGEGAMLTGWQQVNGKWYYLNPNGDMATGWVESQPSCWYYLDSSGVMQTGWVQVNGAWYFFDSNGLMASNTTVDGHQLGANGARIQ